MAFDKNELKQLKDLFNEDIPKIVQPMLDKQSASIMYDIKVLIKHELVPIKQDLD